MSEGIKNKDDVMKRNRYVRVRVDLVLELQEAVEGLPFDPGVAPDYLAKATAEAAYELLPEGLKTRGFSALTHGSRVQIGFARRPR